VNVLEIARQAADDLSLEMPETLFPASEDEPGTTHRRLRRAITRTLETIRDRQGVDWQQSRRVHAFLSQPGLVQHAGIPADFKRFVDQTMFDHTRGVSLAMSESPADFQKLIGRPIPTWEPRWMRRGSDLLISPWSYGSTLSYEYVSTAIVTEPPRAHEVVSSTASPRTLTAFQRCVFYPGHTVVLPALADGETVELLPASGTWGTHGGSITTPGSAPLQVIDVDPSSRDIVTIAQRGSGYEMTAAFGAWVSSATPTANGMTLAPYTRYVVQKGHLLHLPVLVPGEWIELIAATGVWSSLGARLITRGGITVAPPQSYLSSVMVLTADASGAPEFDTSGQLAGQPWSASGNPRLGYAKRKAAVTADTDEPMWSPELVTLGVVAQMQARDGQPAAGDMQAFESALYSEVVANLDGAVLRMGSGEQPSSRRPVIAPVLIDAGGA
jgi:hypothetical protein